jgi:predicted MFS family arabinose efflux permease
MKIKENSPLVVDDAEAVEKHAPPTSNDGLSENGKWVISIAYMLAMGVCGTVLVALGSTLSELAENCDTSATAVGTVFIARGVGAVLGAVLSSKFYLWFQGNHVMGASLTGITFLLIFLPFNKSVVGLHIYFFFLGLGTATTDTGCQIMTRKVHGKTAGPWLGANTVAFGISGALVPLIEIFTKSIIWQYYVIALIIGGVTLMVWFGPNPESNGRLMGGPPKGRPGQDGKIVAPHYNVEIVISIMVFCFIGGKVTSTAYLSTYVSDTDVMSATAGASLILVLWIAITVGRLAGVQDQRFMTNETLPVHLSMLCVGGFLSMLLVLWFPDSADCLWIGVAFYGLFNGPCVGYCYDWNNRVTYPTEKSMAIVMFGLNFGASLVPYLTTVIWNSGAGPITLIYVIFMSMFIPLPLLHLTKCLSYDPDVNPRARQAYESIPQDETEPI